MAGSKRKRGRKQVNNQMKKKESILRNNAFQTIIASLLCIVIGLLIGYIVLLIINPKGAGEAIMGES